MVAAASLGRWENNQRLCNDAFFITKDRRREDIIARCAWIMLLLAPYELRRQGRRRFSPLDDPRMGAELKDMTHGIPEADSPDEDVARQHHHAENM